jgi:uncharacterized protein (TIGR00730 family)
VLTWISFPQPSAHACGTRFTFNRLKSKAICRIGKRIQPESIHTNPQERLMTTETSPDRMQLRFTPTNGPADEAIDELIAMVGGIRQPALVRELILAALKAGQENPEKADLKLMNSSLKEMRFTAKIFGPYRHVRKVSVFGSARTPPDHPVYHMARDLGRQLAEKGYMVITGGGPGIMQAVNEGAGPEHSFGINIRLPFEQQPNPIVAGNPRHINYKYFFNRKVAFLKEADAVVVFPGGFGTLDEGMETLTLSQTGKHYPQPIIMVDVPGSPYWHDWRHFLDKQLVASHYIRPEDMSLFDISDNINHVVQTIENFHRRYHSMRYVDQLLVIRLQERLSTEEMVQIKKAFQDLLIPGGRFWQGSALPEESDDVDALELPRLFLDFNRSTFAGLKALIDAINRL